jgi:hypothetical protein
MKNYPIEVIKSSWRARELSQHEKDMETLLKAPQDLPLNDAEKAALEREMEYEREQDDMRIDRLMNRLGANSSQ